MQPSATQLYSVNTASRNRRQNRRRLSAKRLLEAQLARGFWSLRFAGELEADFCRFLAYSGRFSRASVSVMAFVAVLLAPFVDTGWLGMPAPLALPSHWVQLGFMLPLTAGCGLMCWFLPTPRLVELAMMVLFAGIMAALMFQRALDSQYGFDFPPEFIGATVVAMFALARIRFWVMLAATVLATAAMAGNEWLFVAAPVNAHYHLFATVLLIVVGVLGGYSFEYLLRWTWLNGTLMRYLSRLDSLTGLLNRYALEDTMARAHAQARRQRIGYAVAMVDIDAFGAYNDHYGHQSGDVALRRVAGVLNAFARRPQDVCGRYGGEEFVVLWTEGSHDELCDLAVAACNAVRRLRIAHAVSTVAPWVTVSVGLCYVDAASANVALNDVLGAADRLLYEAKHDGRNRVFCARFEPGRRPAGAPRRAARR